MRFWKRALACVLACMTAAASAEELLCVSAKDCAALLTEEGREVVAPGSYDRVFPLTGDRFALGVRTEDGMRYALCDEEGRLLTDAQYEMLKASQGAVLFRQGGLYGAMGMDGEAVIPAQYTQLAAAGDGGYLAMTGNPYDEEADRVLRISADGTAFETAVYTDEGLSPLSDGLMPYQDPSNELYGYMAADGTVAIPAGFETADVFSGGLARASKDGLLGVIGTDGAWRIAPEYDYLEIGDGVIVALAGRERAAAFDMLCREVFRVEGTQLEIAVAGGYPVVLEGDVLRVYSAEGDELLEADRGAMVSAGLDGQLIVSDGLWGSACVRLINPDGTSPEGAWQHLLPLNAGRYAFVRMNAAAYYSDALGEIRYSVDYDSLRFGMMDGRGNQILPAEYLEISALGEERYLTVADDGLRVVDGGGNVIWSHLEEE